MSGRSAWPLAALVACTAFTCSGCQEDATAASSLTLADVRSAGQHEVEAVRRRVSEEYFAASLAVAQARREAHRTTVEGEREIARAQARADYEVGIKTCDLLAHDARVSCTAKVEKRYQRALMSAERIEYAYLE